MSFILPAEIGAPLSEIDTPALVLDLEAFERNLEAMRRFVAGSGLRLRAHAKSHKCAEIARRQIEHGGAIGVCCQKTSEAEALIAGGVADVLISNQVVGARKIERLAALARRARLSVCVDDASNVAALSEACARYDAELGVLVEIDVGQNRCGVAPGAAAVALAKRIAAAPGLRFDGLQAYHGRAQHFAEYEERRAAIEKAAAEASETLRLLREAGLACPVVAGAGTGSYGLEAASGVYTELQCGSYVFMDAAYKRVLGQDGAPLGPFENSLFVLATVMSKTKRERAVCDAGLKSLSVDSGLPIIYGRRDLLYENASDEHGELSDPENRLRLGERLLLIPGHCDPTVNLHDWYVGVRNGRVEALWEVTARGMSL